MEPCGQVPFVQLLESQGRGPPSHTESTDGQYPNVWPGHAREPVQPEAAHRWTCPEPVTTVAHSDTYLFAGTVSGTILVYDLQTYQEVNCVAAHTGSVLTLLVQDGLLFSGSSDSLVKVWVPGPEPQFRHTIYMVSDIGDVFSLAYHAATSTLYIGTQNASIHWARLDDMALRPSPEHRVRRMPAVRPSRFFDSTGPGGKLAPQQHEVRKLLAGEASAGNSSGEDEDDDVLVEVPLDHQITFAHNSAVFAMVLDARRRTLITGSGDGLVKIWALAADGRPTEAHKLMTSDSVLSMAMASAWQMCCGLDSGAVLLVDLDTLQVMRHDIPHSRGPVLGLAAVEDAIFLTSGNTMLAYDATTSELYTWQTQGMLIGAITLPAHISAGQLVTAGSDGSVVLWNILIYGDGEQDPDASTPTGFAASNSIGIATNGAAPSGTNSSSGTNTPGSASSENAAAATAATSTGNNNNNNNNNSSSSSENLLLKTRKLRLEPLGNDAMIQFLRDIVKFQTVSGRDRQHWSDSRRCATALRDQMRLFGAESDLLRVEHGNPIVIAEFKANADEPSQHRIMFYGHYDVIEAKKDDIKWRTPPFQLTSINGYIYGRGVTDNKGPCVAAFYAVARLHANKRLTSDVVFLIEGEEESGSFGFVETVMRHRRRIGTIDWIIFSNSLWLDDRSPCLNYGLRGVIFVEIELTSGKGDLHSGVDGGLFREPAKDMINLLAKLTTDTEGKIAIPGFLDSVMPVTDAEEQLYEDIVAATKTAKSDLMHKWRYPSLTIHKFDVSGPNNQTVIPASVKAYISLRLVPAQTAQEATQQLREHLDAEFAKFNSSNALHIRVKYEADPWLGDPHNRVFTLMRDAVEDVWGMPPLFIREGGSIPMARALEKIFDAPAAQLPCGQSSDGAHLNNERIRITNILNARSVFERVFAELGERPRGAPRSEPPR